MAGIRGGRAGREGTMVKIGLSGQKKKPTSESIAICCSVHIVGVALSAHRPPSAVKYLLEYEDRDNAINRINPKTDSTPKS